MDAFTGYLWERGISYYGESSRYFEIQTGEDVWESVLGVLVHFTVRTYFF